jgi:hydrogenase expression/formation protein HypD
MADRDETPPAAPIPTPLTAPALDAATPPTPAPPDPAVDADLDAIRAAMKRTSRSFTFTDVCGVHTAALLRTGLADRLPATVKLNFGPGCPVCVLPAGEIAQLLDIARRPDTIVCTFGDLLAARADPCTSTAAVPSSLAALAQAREADVRGGGSALDAVQLAAAEPAKHVVLAAFGFETAAPATAVAVVDADQRKLDNFSVFSAHRLSLPAMNHFCQQTDTRPDGFICPGHVAAVVGAHAYWPIVSKYNVSCVVSAYAPHQLSAALLKLVQLAINRTPSLENLYPHAVQRYGNRQAQNLVHSVFTKADALWRGLGVLPLSGLQVRRGYRKFDARQRMNLPTPGDGPPAPCDAIHAGRATPAACPLFGSHCTPSSPCGPCMSSSTGVCRAHATIYPASKGG